MKKHILAMLFFGFSAAQAEEKLEDPFIHPFYFGGVGGWGSTTWQGLVPRAQNQNSATSISTPIAVQEGGGVWGLSLGYEPVPCFALEANYMAFPNAKIVFDEYSLYSFEQNNVVLNSHAQTASLSAKVMLWIPKTSVRIFSSAGVAGVFRQDDVNHAYRLSPAFGFGVNMVLSQRIFLELGANYTAGYGESELNPVVDFIPFLYSVFGKLALRFG